MKRAPLIYCLAVLAADSSEPPDEFRIFTSGKVETTKGTFLFDDQAAKSVMASYKEHGVDLMIDYDHASLGSPADPALASRAAGWFNIELRNGELWATNVRWTPAAAAALRAKEWRFMSPAFSLKDGRITSLLNVALTNIPASHRLDPLMAAHTQGMTMASADSGLSPKLVSAALEAVASKDAKTSLDLLKQILAALLGSPAADPDATTEDAPPPAGDGGADESTETPSMSTSAKDDGALLTFAMTLTGKKTGGAAMSELIRAFKLVGDVEKREAAVAASRQAIELETRKANAVKLQQLGAETPHTSGLAEGKLCKRLLDEPLDEQNARVAALLSAKGGKIPTGPKAPAEESTNEHGLSAQELAMCKQMNCEPAAYAALKKQRDGAITAQAGS